jgi:hypothetical protein
MTEAEWLAAQEPDSLLKVIQAEASDRKLRLFAVACFQPFAHHCTDVRSQNAFRTSEGYAEGTVELYALISAHLYATDVVDSFPEPDSDTYDYADDAAYFAAQLCQPFFPFRDGEAEIDPLDVAHLINNISYLSGHSQNHFRIGGDGEKAIREKGVAVERVRQCSLLRDIFGNPFRPVSVDPAWLTETVVALAEGIYHERAFDRMPILADALEDTGCDNADMLNHCRQPGEHVRGCWVVDLLTGRK